ncbi:MAG: divalent-cation tolerance protein CutA [Polyangiaceae bacterium]|nr:divalent-cation tolerance protein CutA [Polyangiaceae bacterium]
MSIVLINAPPDDAPRIARALVEQKLAACVNVIPGVKSFYFWDGALQEDSESTLVVKTTDAALEDLTAAVKKLHPYSVPEVIALPLSDAGNPEYLSWVKSSVRG